MKLERTLLIGVELPTDFLLDDESEDLGELLKRLQYIIAAYPEFQNLRIRKDEHYEEGHDCRPYWSHDTWHLVGDRLETDVELRRRRLIKANTLRQKRRDKKAFEQQQALALEERRKQYATLRKEFDNG